jgi:predicted acyltransferase
MKYAGILVLVIGLLLCLFSLNMNVSVEVDSQSYGYGITTPSMRVANADLMAQRQNYLIFSGILSVVGAILAGFGAIAPKAMETAETQAEIVELGNEDRSNDDRIIFNNGVYTVDGYGFDRIEGARLFAAQNPTKGSTHSPATQA